MTVYLVDGHGGGVGKGLAERLKHELPQIEIIALGTNSAATSAMLRAGADNGATGENAIVHCCGRAKEDDVVAGPIGIVLANAMLGEFTPAMARAVGESAAHKVLIPISRCQVSVAGIAPDKPMAQYLDDAVAIVRACRREDKI